MEEAEVHLDHSDFDLHQEVSQFDELMSKVNELAIQVNVLSEENKNLKRQLSKTTPTSSDEERLTSISSTPVSYVVNRENIPAFKAEISAAHPLRRNQEVESWIRSIENLARPQNDQAFMAAARATARGSADLIVNSPIFDNITNWGEFKAKLRLKFRGSCSSTDFFRLLYENKLMAGQAPLDYYVQLEGQVYQGYRDHPEAIGDPDELIKRVFLMGLPPWLRETLALKENESVSSLTDAAQRLWNARCGVSREIGPERIPASHRSRPVAAVEEGRARPYCTYHQSNTHDTAECRARGAMGNRQCFNCRENGHIARECPFPYRPRGRGPASGPATRGPSFNTEATPCNYEVSPGNTQAGQPRE